MVIILKRSGLAVALLLTALPAATHHSRAIFDGERTVTVEGVVTRYEWANPHVYLHVETQTDTGDPVVWALEHSSTTMMRRQGWSRNTFAPGERVIVQGNPARETSNMALVVSVERAGVKLYDRINRGEGFDRSEESRVGATGLTGTWVVPREQPYFGRFSDPSSWPVTEKGAEVRANYDDRTMNPQLLCQSRTAPWFMIFPSVQRIEVGDTSVTIRSEYNSIERTVHMDVASHERAAVMYQGHSIGWWEGDVLVVDTTHFSDHRNGNARGISSGSQKHVVERFELNPDRTSLTYRFELEDPEYLAAPVTGELVSTYRPDVEFSPVECDLENARRFVGD